jgi:hypothetical protein
MTFEKYKEDLKQKFEIEKKFNGKSEWLETFLEEIKEKLKENVKFIVEKQRNTYYNGLVEIENFSTREKYVIGYNPYWELKLETEWQLRETHYAGVIAEQTLTKIEFRKKSEEELKWMDWDLIWEELL